MSTKSMTWDATADRKLLLGILKLQSVTIDYDAMSKYMSNDGTICTVSAIQNRINRLKAQANKEGGAGSPGGVDTPLSRGKGGGRKKRAATAISDDDEKSPSKMAKKTKTAASVSGNEGDQEGGVENVIKAEEDADDDA